MKKKSVKKVTSVVKEAGVKKSETDDKKKLDLIWGEEAPNKKRI